MLTTFDIWVLVTLELNDLSKKLVFFVCFCFTFSTFLMCPKWNGVETGKHTLVLIG